MSPKFFLAAATVPALTAIDPVYGFAMALGLLGGFFARAGVAVKDRKPWEEIKRDALVSLMASIGSVIITLYIARTLNADELGIAAIGFAVTFGGTDAMKVFDKFIWEPIIGPFRSNGDKK